MAEPLITASGPSRASPRIGIWNAAQLESYGPMTPTTAAASAYSRAFRRQVAGVDGARSDARVVTRLVAEPVAPGLEPAPGEHQADGVGELQGLLAASRHLQREAGDDHEARRRAARELDGRAERLIDRRPAPPPPALDARDPP